MSITDAERSQKWRKENPERAAKLQDATTANRRKRKEENPDFAEVARNMGAHGVRVEDPDEIGSAIDEMLETETPSVVEIIQDGTELLEPFRRDALDDPERVLEKYRQPGDANYEE